MRNTLIFVCLCGLAWGQLPDAPSHQFLDTRAKVLFTIGGGLVIADAMTTQHIIQAHGAEELNPLARPMVTRGWKGQIAASALGYGSALGLAYVFHRTGHHRMERLVPMVLVGAETAAVANNMVWNAGRR